MVFLLGLNMIHRASLSPSVSHEFMLQGCTVNSLHTWKIPTVTCWRCPNPYRSPITFYIYVCSICYLQWFSMHCEWVHVCMYCLPLRLRHSHQHLTDMVLTYLSISQDQLSIQMSQGWRAKIRFGSDGQVLENGWHCGGHFRGADESMSTLKNSSATGI